MDIIHNAAPKFPLVMLQKILDDTQTLQVSSFCEAHHFDPDVQIPLFPADTYMPSEHADVAS